MEMLLPWIARVWIDEIMQILGCSSCKAKNGRYICMMGQFCRNLSYFNTRTLCPAVTIVPLPQILKYACEIVQSAFILSMQYVTQPILPGQSELLLATVYWNRKWKAQKVCVTTKDVETCDMAPRGMAFFVCLWPTFFPTMSSGL